MINELTKLPQSVNDLMPLIQDWFMCTKFVNINERYLILGDSCQCGANPYAMTSPSIVMACSPEQALYKVCMMNNPEYFQMDQTEYDEVLKNLKSENIFDELNLYIFTDYLKQKYYGNVSDEILTYITDEYAFPIDKIKMIEEH